MSFAYPFGDAVNEFVVVITSRSAEALKMTFVFDQSTEERKRVCEYDIRTSIFRTSSKNVMMFLKLSVKLGKINLVLLIFVLSRRRTCG